MIIELLTEYITKTERWKCTRNGVALADQKGPTDLHSKGELSQTICFVGVIPSVFDSCLPIIKGLGKPTDSILFGKSFVCGFTGRQILDQGICWSQSFWWIHITNMLLFLNPKWVECTRETKDSSKLTWIESEVMWTAKSKLARHLAGRRTSLKIQEVSKVCVSFKSRFGIEKNSEKQQHKITQVVFLLLYLQSVWSVSVWLCGYLPTVFLLYSRILHFKCQLDHGKSQHFLAADLGSCRVHEGRTKRCQVTKNGASGELRWRSRRNFIQRKSQVLLPKWTP